jgi:ADP-heptose:LPS heptosyltransferase
MIYSSGASPLRGRYLVRNPALHAMLRLSDAALEAVRSSQPTHSAGSPRRILLAVGGHLGDAVIATSVLPVLRRRFPDAVIGMVMSSWSSVVVRDHPDLFRIHSVDHWRLNRSAADFTAKWRQYRRTRRRAIDEIRETGYDAAIDLYPYYPNVADVLWRSGIPVRIGYRSGGYGSLYSHAIDWTDTRAHTAEQHLRLLSNLDPEIAEAEVGYSLPLLNMDARMRTTTELRARGLEPGSFLVLHPGAGEARKAWPTAMWLELAERLREIGHAVAITGAGPAEVIIANQIVAGAPGVVNLCDHLDWGAFRAVLASARAAIGVDSVAMHVAAGQGIPCVAIMAGMSDPLHWRPMGTHVEIVTRAVQCAPCFRSDGCAAMSCVRDVSVDDVERALRRVMNAPGGEMLTGAGGSI